MNELELSDEVRQLLRKIEASDRREIGDAAYEAWIRRLCFGKPNSPQPTGTIEWQQ